MTMYDMTARPGTGLGDDFAGQLHTFADALPHHDLEGPAHHFVAR